MKRTLLYALGVSAGMLVVAPAVAQDNFPDAPENHWAYEALLNLKKEGILVGYPDGLFRGSRLATRYEMAAALNAAYMRMKSMADGLSSQMKSLQDMLDGKASADDLKAVRDQLAALQNEVNGMKAWGDDIANMKKMVSAFEKELASLGVDVDAMKKDLGDLEKRVKALEDRKMPVDIHGDVNLLALGGHGDGRGAGAKSGITPYWRVTGLSRDGGLNPHVAGITEDFSVLHESAFTFTGTSDEGPKWQATIVYGNLLSNLGGQGNLNPGAGFVPGGLAPNAGPYSESSSEFYTQTLKAGWDTSVGGFNFSLMLGRQGYKISPYILGRPDTSPEYMNSRWDTGERMFDGVNMSANFGAVKATLLAGKTGTNIASGGTMVDWGFGTIGNQYNYAGSGGFYVPISGYAPGTVVPGEQGQMINQFMGLHVNVPFQDKGGLDLAYLLLESNRSGGPFVGPLGPAGAASINRVGLFGADANFKFQDFMIRGGFSQSNLYMNTKQRWSSDNKAYYGQIGFEQSMWGVTAGYKKVEPFFTAPGSWDRIGTVWNPTGIQGGYGSVWFSPVPELTLKGKVQFYDGSGGPVRSGDKARSFIVGAMYKINSAWDAWASYEDVEFKSALGGAKPTEKWFTVGFGYTMGTNSSLHLMYQGSDLKNIGGFGLPGWGGSTRKGGLFVTQLSVKF